MHDLLDLLPTNFWLWLNESELNYAQYLPLYYYAKGVFFTAFSTLNKVASRICYLKIESANYKTLCLKSV